MTALEAALGGAARIDQACQAAIAGRRAARSLSTWAKRFDLSEPELQVLWCLRQVADGGFDQTTIAAWLALSTAQVSATVERLRAQGWIAQRFTVGDRRRHLWRLSGEGLALVEQLIQYVEVMYVDSMPVAAPPNGVAPLSTLGRTAAALLLVATVVWTTGCSRAYYRKQADAEVNCIIDNKSIALDVAPGSLNIKVDPRSRMYDPNNPDCPPQPPDDPISHQLMNCVDCKPGSPAWKKARRTAFTDNPRWEDYLPRDADGNVVLDLTGAVQTALLESPNYQRQLETLYLSSLDVTFERFRFDSQFFGGSSIFFTADGRNRSGTGNSSSQLEVSPFAPASPLRVERLTATGGELVVGLANSLVWQFAGPDDYSSRTILDFSLIQPILRAGGRTVVLERLTIAERALLANVRQMEQYRRGFYLNVVTGRDAGQGPNRRGGFFGGSGLEGFAGVGGGGFGQVGQNQNQQQNQQAGFTGGAGAQQAGGYLGLLQTAQVIRNQYSNIAELGDSVEQLQAAYDAGRIDRFQVDLARQALYNAQSQLLISSNQYQTNLDNFKLLYGLPPNLDVRISDPMLDRFNLLDPQLARVQTQVTDLLGVLREGSDAEVEGDQPPGGPDLRLNPPAVVPLSPAQLAELAATAREVSTSSQQYLASTEEDYQKLQAGLPQRRKALEKLAARDDVRDANIDEELLSTERLDQRAAAVRNDLDELTKRLQITWARVDVLTAGDVSSAAQSRTDLTSALTDLSGELLELSLLQARARLDTITFEPVELTPEQGYCIASRNRRDWMNARAALVDSWRLIAFNADALQSDLDFVFSGDIGNVGDNPLRLRGTNGRLRVGLQFDSPLTRLSERNTYRQSLIEFQQAKRTYYQFRDRVHRDVRNSLRQTRLDELNFELRRGAVQVAITQVDLTRLRLSEPARPVAAAAPGQVAEPGGGQQFGATVARDLVNALVDLLNVQNDFLSVWVDHEVQRIQLDFDLGIMELDPGGLRIEHDQPLDAFVDQNEAAAPCEAPSPCAVRSETSGVRTGLPGLVPGGGDKTPEQTNPVQSSPEQIEEQKEETEMLPLPLKQPEILPLSPSAP